MRALSHSPRGELVNLQSSFCSQLNKSIKSRLLLNQLHNPPILGDDDAVSSKSFLKNKLDLLFALNKQSFGAFEVVIN